LEDGPPSFPPDFSCPKVLWIPLAGFDFHVRGFHPVSRRFPDDFH
jgi:hypothetical protein